MAGVKTGIIGCGNISGIYIKNCLKFENLDLVALADILPERAEKAAAENSLKACSVDELLADPEIEIVLNLTIPAVHAAVNTQIIDAGKHAYVEKPLSVTRADAAAMMERAEKKNVRVGCAPDTFMGAGIQTCRKLMDDGAIGDVVGATAFMMCHGHESWHPDPEFYYQKGGGPMLDMGPYYVTAMVNLIGPVRAVSGMTRISFPERTITSEKKNGQTIEVEVPTHVAGLLEFDNQAIGTIITSFDVWSHRMPCIEIYGSKGTLRVPDPNTFGGVPELKIGKDGEWQEIELTHDYAQNSRGIGVSDMADAVRGNGAFRASGTLALHVLDVMESLHDSARQRTYMDITHQCDRPEPMPVAADGGAQ